MRIAWLSVGIGFTAVGFAGLVLPLLPGTPFFLVAAYAFARSSPRLESWLLGLPHVGEMIREYREGLGVRRRVKLLAVTMASLAVALSATLAPSPLVKLGVVLAGVAGVAFLLFRVPTRESVLAEREADLGED